MSDEEVKQLPKAGFTGEIEIIEDYHEQNRVASFLSDYRVIGFDTESRASFKKGVVNKVSLVQLSAGGKAFLIRVNKVKLSAGILKIMESAEHIKVGVALAEDVREILGLGKFSPAGFFDLQRVMSDFSIGELSLKKMSAIVLGIQVSKAQRLSNWEASKLTEAQMVYAATDAWVCEEIFKTLELDTKINNKGFITIRSREEVEREKIQKARARRHARMLKRENNINNKDKETDK